MLQVNTLCDLNKVPKICTFFHFKLFTYYQLFSVFLSLWLFLHTSAATVNILVGFGDKSINIHTVYKMAALKRRNQPLF